MKPTLKIISAALLDAAFIAPIFAQEIPARAGTRELQASGSLPPPKAVDSVEIAKKLANPIANMILVPLQYQFSRGAGVGQGGSVQSALLQPVAPFDWGVVTH